MVLKLAKGYLENEDLSTAWARQKGRRLAGLPSCSLRRPPTCNFIRRTGHQSRRIRTLTCPSAFVIKMGLIDELAEILRKMGKQVTVSYY